MAWALAKETARTILTGFERHFRLFQDITAKARERFEGAQWQRVQEASRERVLYYDKRVNETIEILRGTFNVDELDEVLWQRIKVEYVRLLHQHRQPELAETFYNSVFCRLFDRKYFNNRNIFVRPAVSTERIESDIPVYRCYYPGRDGYHRVISVILDACRFTLPFRHRRRDIRNLLRAVRRAVPAPLQPFQNFQLAVLSAVFFRNKAAYIIGKAVNGAQETPFVIAVLNDERGGLYVDSLLVGEQDLANVFSFTRAYFMVETDVPSAVVEFLWRLLPGKTKAELYTAIGLQKHGKTEFYRDFLQHLRHSSDAFVEAPGIKGMVMTVFTLPSYPYVFKVINDRTAAPKDVSRETVKRKYQLVKEHDRVGRMADSLEYSEAAFPLNRFSARLLSEIRADAASSLEIEGDQIVIKHLYIERRMVPLNIFIESADSQQLRRVLAEYGNAIKQLAAANIFPGDMLLKNFGVTRQERVVFYDYDEICYMTECNFRKIPEPLHPEDEFAEEPWYSVGPNDVFPEEFVTFLVTNPRLRQIFLEMHAELLDPAYWRRKQDNIREGLVEDVFPYPDDKRFTRSGHATSASSGPGAGGNVCPRENPSATARARASARR